MPLPTAAIAPSTLRLIERLFEREGHISDHPMDRGGFTKWGITMPTLSKWLQRPASRGDLQALDIETARQIYYRFYWMDTKIYTLEVAAGLSIAEFLFDWRVNSGSAIFEFQEYLKVKRDGDLGPKTVFAAMHRVRDLGEKQVLAELCDHRMDFYIDLCRMDPSQIAFIRGWHNRVKGFRPKFPPR